MKKNEQYFFTLVGVFFLIFLGSYQSVFRVEFYHGSFRHSFNISLLHHSENWPNVRFREVEAEKMAEKMAKKFAALPPKKETQPPNKMAILSNATPSTDKLSTLTHSSQANAKAENLPKDTKAADEIGPKVVPSHSEVIKVVPNSEKIQNASEGAQDVTIHSTESVTTLTNFALPQCPPVPKMLVGRLKIVTKVIEFGELEKLHEPILPGGRYHPPDCESRHRVAIVIPFRNRDDQLKLFLNHIHPILMRQDLDYGIYVINQAGEETFNRAMLMNVGFVEALKERDWDCFIFHDVDLLPEDDRNIYSCPEKPRHLSVAVSTLNYALPYQDIFGGASALKTEHVKMVNGFSNQFWGWGGEDDDMSNRVRSHGFKIIRYPANIARYTMIKHSKEEPNKNRYNLLRKSSQRFEKDGLNNLDYERLSLQHEKLYTNVTVILKKVAPVAKVVGKARTK